MTVHQVVKSIVLMDPDIAAISVNCMSVHKVEDVYTRIYEGMEEARQRAGKKIGTVPIVFPGTSESKLNITSKAFGAFAAPDDV